MARVPDDDFLRDIDEPDPTRRRGGQVLPPAGTVTLVEYRSLMMSIQKVDEKLDRVLAWIATQRSPAEQLAARYKRGNPDDMGIGRARLTQ